MTKINRNPIKKYNKTRKIRDRKHLCYAPFSSLLFIQSGHAMACHYNRGTVLGKYSENSIKDIWFGQQIKTLRKYILNNDLSYGCDSCATNIKNGNFFSVGAKRYENLSKFAKYPVMIDFQLQNTCNLECVMCSGEYSSAIRQQREQKPKYINPYDDDFLLQLNDFIPHLSHAKFTGGEPFLINMYYEIWNKILNVNKNIEISISSNGTVLNDKIKKILEHLKFNFTISIDSITESNYNKIRRNADFSAVMNNIKYFIDYSKSINTYFAIKFVVIQQNWQEIPDFFDYWNNKSIRLIPKMVWFPPHASIRDMHAHEIKEIAMFLESKKFSMKNKIQKENVKHYNSIVTQIKQWHMIRASIQDNSFVNKQMLEEELIDRIKKYLNGKSYINEVDKNNKLKKYNEIISHLTKSIDNYELMIFSFKKFCELPVDIIVAEMEREETDRLVEKFKQICYY